MFSDGLKSICFNGGFENDAEKQHCEISIKSSRSWIMFADLET